MLLHFTHHYPCPQHTARNWTLLILVPQSLCTMPLLTYQRPCTWHLVNPIPDVSAFFQVPLLCFSKLKATAITSIYPPIHPSLIYLLVTYPSDGITSYWKVHHAHCWASFNNLASQFYNPPGLVWDNDNDKVEGAKVGAKNVDLFVSEPTQPPKTNIYPHHPPTQDFISATRSHGFAANKIQTYYQVLSLFYQFSHEKAIVIGTSSPISIGMGRKKKIICPSTKPLTFWCHHQQSSNLAVR